MDEKELQTVANILRRDVLEMTTAAGSGHPSSCLSCAEIISTLFFHEMKYDAKNSENLNNDEFILSKGHAAPILYSALFRAGVIKTDLMKLRKLNSPLEGHPIPRSLTAVKVATGSLGQGLAVGVGMALAARLHGRTSKVYVLAGDSEMAEGSVYEALRLAPFYNLNNLCLIIDVNRLGQTGETQFGYDLEKYAAGINSFGWKSVIVDGHSVPEILNAFDEIRKSKQPCAIIAKTIKGKGVSFIENKENWHGRTLIRDELNRALKEIPNNKMPSVIIQKPSPFEIKTVKSKKAITENFSIGELVATREAYGTALAHLAEARPDVLAVDAEVSNSTFSERVKQVRPGQFIEAFIAEQNLVGMCLGLSKKGFRVFGSTFAAFLTRAHDQIRMAALSSADFSLCGSHAGVSIGEDGASQMGLEDLAMFRALPNSTIFYPSDAVSTQKLVNIASKLKGISYIRTTRGKTPVIYSEKEKFDVGDFKIVKESKKDKIVLIGAGITLHECLKAHEILKNQKINSAVIDLYCVKPFNSKKFIAYVKKHGKRMVVVEDHYEEGGIGEMLAEELENTEIKIKHLFVGEIPHSGKPNELLEKYGIDSKAIVTAAKKLMS